MACVTIPVDKSFKERLAAFPWINWSEVGREEFVKKEKQLEAWKEVEKIVSNSKLTQEQADKISDKINRSLAKRYEALLERKK